MLTTTPVRQLMKQLFNFVRLHGCIWVLSIALDDFLGRQIARLLLT
jgi:hypothetical protein